MWEQSYRTTLKNFDAQRLWNVWRDVNGWHTWQRDIDYAQLKGPFEAGSSFVLKPKGAPRVNIELLNVEVGSRFVDLTRFPLARMYGDHRFEQRGNDVEVTTSIRVEGALSYLWRKLVAEGIVRGLPDQTAWLVERAAAL